MGLFGPPKMAGCPRDGTPLIPTTAFIKKEFYCLECGGTFEFLSPRGLDPTAEVNEWYDNLKAEWDEHVAGKLIPEGTYWLEACDKCRPFDYEASHNQHLTDDDRKADEEARAWLRERVAGSRA